MTSLVNHGTATAAFGRAARARWNASEQHQTTRPVINLTLYGRGLLLQLEQSCSSQESNYSIEVETRNFRASVSAQIPSLAASVPLTARSGHQLLPLRVRGVLDYEMLWRWQGLRLSLISLAGSLTVSVSMSANKFLPFCPSRHFNSSHCHSPKCFSADNPSKDCLAAWQNDMLLCHGIVFKSLRI